MLNIVCLCSSGINKLRRVLTRFWVQAVFKCGLSIKPVQVVPTLSARQHAGLSERVPDSGCRCQDRTIITGDLVPEDDVQKCCKPLSIGNGTTHFL